MKSGNYIFQSSLADEMISHIALKRSLGRKYESEEWILWSFDRFLVRRFPNTRDLSLHILREWLAEHSLQVSTRATWLTIVRQFCLYLQRTRPGVYVPSQKNARPIWPARIPRHRPHIYTQEELKNLLSAALSLAPTTINPFRPQTFFNLFLLLYATGLRISEALGLQWNDVDWYAGTILISESKFHKTRVVPLHKEMLSSLLKYRRVLDSSEGCPSGNSPVFQQGGGRAYSCITARQVWRSLLRLCNIEVSTGKKVPRIHDLRHSFAVERITLWYQEGADVQNLQPRLATYMGHKNLRSTQYYITITMEILKSAGERFECVCSPRRRK